MEEALELARTPRRGWLASSVSTNYSKHRGRLIRRASLVDVCLDLLKDNNFRVSQGALQALDSAAVLSGEHLKLHFNALVPTVVERFQTACQGCCEEAFAYSHGSMSSDS